MNIQSSYLYFTNYSLGITCPKIDKISPNVETDTPLMNSTNLSNGTSITYATYLTVIVY